MKITKPLETGKKSSGDMSFIQFSYSKLKVSYCKYGHVLNVSTSLTESHGSINGTRKVVEGRRLNGNKIRKHCVFLLV